MKKIFLIIICFLFFSQNGLSQTEPREIKYFRYTNDWVGNDFRKTYASEKAYNIHGDISTKIIKVYNTDESIQIWQGGFYEYDANQLLKKYTSRRYNQDVDLWITNLWINYKHDQNGCRLEEQTTKNVGGIISRRVTYTRNSDCRITSQLVEWLGNGFDLSTKDYFIRDYHFDGISYDEKFYSSSSIGDTLYLQKDRKIIYDQNENISEAYWTIFYSTEDTIYSAKNFYTYDDHNNVTSNYEYRNHSVNGWQLHRQDLYENEYDENGFLNRKKLEVWNYDDSDPPIGNLTYTREYFYQNSCEGIVEEYTSKEDGSGIENRYEFVYEGINECFDIENLDFQMIISPNPSSGEIEIKSPIFKTGNTDISVFSIDGKVLLQKKERSRCESSFIDLTSLQNGIYILQLQNGKHFVNEKIALFK